MALNAQALGPILSEGTDVALYNVWEEDFTVGFIAPVGTTSDSAGALLWTANGVGALVPVLADLKDEQHGVLAINTAGTADDAYVTWRGHNEYIIPTVGKRIIFKARFNLREVTQSDMWFGIHDNASTVAGTIVDGFYFRKDDGDANLDFVYEAADTAVATTAILAMAADQDYTLAFEYLCTAAGAGVLSVYIDGVVVAGLDNLRITTGAPNALMTIGGAIKNGQGAAAIMDLDYMAVAVER